MNGYKMVTLCLMIFSFIAGYSVSNVLNPTTSNQAALVVSDTELNQLKKQSAALQKQLDQRDQYIQQLKTTSLANTNDATGSFIENENTLAHTVNPESPTTTTIKTTPTTLPQPSSANLDITAIKDKFQQENKDWAFSAEQESTLMQQFGQSEQLQHVSLQSVECKTSLCKLTISNNHGNGIGDLFNTIPAGLDLENLPPHQQGYIIVPNEEMGTTSVYLNRGDEPVEEFFNHELVKVIPEVQVTN